MPRLLVYLDAIRHNAGIISGACTRAGASCLPVMKTALLHPSLARTIAEAAGVNKIGIVAWPGYEPDILSGLDLHHIYAQSDSLSGGTSDYDTVYVNSRHVLLNLNEHGGRKRPALRLVLECGDSRDGFLPEELAALAEEAVRRDFPLRGLSINFACLSKQGPTLLAMKQAEAALDAVRTFAPDADISAGGTDVLEFTQNNKLPASIHEIRCGTGIFLGVYPLTGNPIPGCRQDAFLLEGTVLECRNKAGQKRALLDFGSFHTDCALLSPMQSGLTFIAESAAYAVYDATECSTEIHEGQKLKFTFEYRSLTRALSSQALPMEIRP